MAEHLGGLLPLLHKDALDEKGKAFWDELESTMVPWARESGFQAEGEGGLIGPFNALLYSPATGSAMMAYLKAEKETTSLTPRVREIVILTVGAVWKAAYELYAHSAVAKKVGIDAADIESLACGQPPAGLRGDEMTAHLFVHKLVTQHTVEPTLYDAAEAAFGKKGVVDMVHLTGLYMTTSALLNTFAVPTPE